MTVHWLDEEEVTRRSACLGVRRIYVSKVVYVSKVMSSIHAEFKTSSKVNLTITDNGSKFLKAFRMSEEANKESPTDTDDEDIFEEEDEDDVEYINIGEIIERHTAAKSQKSDDF